MIGGSDIIIPVKDARMAMDMAICAAARMWNHPVFEDADTGHTFQDLWQVIVAPPPELLIYRDAAAQEAWKRLGADDSLNGTMIHLIARDGELTIAVDDVPGPKIRSYIESVRTGLCNALSA
jgi:hypothetical protein